MNLTDIFNQTPHQRNQAMRNANQPTHCGPGIPWAIEMYRREMRNILRRRPTHKGADVGR